MPEVADWCAVDLATNSGTLERKALAHVDPEVLERAIALSERYPTDPDSPAGVYQVVRSGQAELYPEIPDELLREGAVDEEHYRELVAIGMRSAIIVPMTTRGQTLGALTFVSGPSGRRFDEQDVELAQELARRCATAIDNARLYTERSYIARTLQQSLLPVGAAGHPRRRGRGALPAHGRGQRGRRRLLRPVRDAARAAGRW